VGAVIVDWRRSPFTRAHKGLLSNVRPDDFAGQVISDLLSENQIKPSQIDDVIVGCAYPEGEQGYNIGRMLVYLSGLPNTVPGTTINRLCGSSMQAIVNASAYISSGWGDCYICGGLESMSRIQRRGFNWSTHPELEQKYPQAYIGMGLTAENVANAYEISRQEQEEFALESHMKASIAQRSGFFSTEISPINYESGVISEDGCIRSETSIEMMAKLSPAFLPDGSVTAATSSPLTDGATFSLICSEKFCEENGLQPIARIVASAVTGCPPELMGLGPISATSRVLERTGWNISEIDIFELNEAFSSQSIACIREIGIDQNRVNLDGGSIAIGHPLGASGARITCKAASLLKRNGKKRAIATMCIGGGMGIATALEGM